MTSARVTSLPLLSRTRRLRAWGPLAIAAVLSLATVACGAHKATGPSVHPERSTVPTYDVNDDGFASAVRDLLVTEPRSQERAVRLQGVESRQMARALAKFKVRAGERGLLAVKGGLYLSRVGELASETLGASGVEALKHAVKELAQRGDEGRARAVYEILARAAPQADRAEIQKHLDALKDWTRDAVATGGPLQSSGAMEKVAVRRRLLEPSAAALDDAAAVVTEWIKRAVALQKQFRQTRSALSREEATEAYRALQSGAAVLAALYLRDGDAVGALQAVDKAGAREMLPNDFGKALEVVADGPDAFHWLDVLRSMRPLMGRGASQEEDDFAEDRELFRAAGFGVALEAYRYDPTVPEAAAFVAAGLEELGMAEAAPAVLLEAAKAHPDPRTLGAALTITMHAMQVEMEGSDPDGARRTFRAAQPLLALGDARNALGKLKPSSARVRAMMGEIELTEGHVDQARALMRASVAAEKSGHVLLSLARIEWRDHDVAAAIEHLREGLSAEDGVKDHALRGEILLTLSDITREKGDVGAARTPLTEALKELVHSHNSPDPEDRSKVERMLARVLDRFGETQSAERALERAFTAASRDKNQISQTVGQLVSRAFVRGDITAARDGLSRGIAADLDGDDVVYLALWVRLLEKQRKLPTDGAPDRVFAGIADDGKWASRLAAFGTGKLRAEELIAAAKTPTQKTEAIFYAAMDRRAAGDIPGAMEALKQVIAGGSVQLVEVSLARDILDGARAQVGPPPPGVAIP